MRIPPEKENNAALDNAYYTQIYNMACARACVCVYNMAFKFKHMYLANMIAAVLLLWT